MHKLARLEAPLEGVAALGGPLAQVGALGSVLRNPLLLLLLGLGALLAWGAVTFVAVRYAIISAARATRGQEST